MAESTQGTTGYLFGIAATSPTGAVFQNLRKAASDDVVNYVRDENNKRITKRSDDETGQITAVMKIKASGFTRVAINAKLTITGGAFAGDYVIVSTDEGQPNGDFTDYTITAESMEYIVPA